MQRATGFPAAGIVIQAEQKKGCLSYSDIDVKTLIQNLDKLLPELNA